MIKFERARLKYNLRPTGIIHIGAHTGQEWVTYRRLKVKKVIFVEPCERQFKILESRFKENPNVTLINKALGNYTGQVMMNVEERNGGMSNSILTPFKHLEIYPDIQFKGTELVDITRLDDLEFDRNLYDMIVIDVQGYEGEVFKGAEKTLEHIKVIYTEVNTVEMYENNVMLPDLDKILRKFRRVEVLLQENAWGDAIYIRK